MEKFIPKRVFFEEAALHYSLGKKLLTYFSQEKIITKIIESHNRVTGIPGKTPQQGYNEAKNTLVVGVRKSDNFQTCKPSAHFQLPLVTSCPGKCEYCYLQTTLGKKPYIRIYVNTEEILARAQKYVDARKPEITLFEGAATSDPVPVEYLSGSLKKSIEFFGAQDLARFRFVTKFTDIDDLLPLKHNGHTTFRFSINSSYVIKNFEHNTPQIADRIEAAGKVATANYPLGFIIGPIFYYEDYQNDYRQMLKNLSSTLKGNSRKIRFELITHRFTTRAKNNILELFPKTTLPLEEADRKVKYGQFGYVKYIYPEKVMEELKDFFVKEINEFFPQGEIDYFI